MLPPVQGYQVENPEQVAPDVGPLDETFTDVDGKAVTAKVSQTQGGW
jgi:hypothetical protein